MKKELNFEINILPILDILSVLICFLLLTAVWIQVGTLDTKQAIGDNSSAGSKNPPSMWIMVGDQGNLEVSLRDVSNQQQALSEKILPTTGGANFLKLAERIQMIRSQIPDLKTAIIRPAAHANYGNVIRVMDELKQKQINDVGLSPLG